MGINLSQHDAEAVLSAVKGGRTLSGKTREAIRRQLASRACGADAYTLIHILGKADDTESKNIIESFLDFGLADPSDDGMVRRIALQVLGQMWELPETFEVAAHKVFDDPSPYVRAMAAAVIGSLGARYLYLRSKAAQLLIRGFEQRSTEREIVWESLHDGLLDLLDIPYSERPLPTRGLKEQDIRWDILEKARQLIPQERGERAKGTRAEADDEHPCP
jgi:hypothetical protein